MENESSEPESPKRGRGRPAIAPELRRSHPVVTNLSEGEHARAKAWAAAQGRPLGECVRALLLPLIVACGLMLAGCGAGGLSAAMLAAKPVARATCAGVRIACDMAETACGLVDAMPASSGAEVSPE